MPPPPTSVLLPTVRWTDACDEVAAQLRPPDELLVICDSAADPVADRRDDLPEGVRVVLAGEPAGCSGKANAIAVGMEAAAHDRLVWTDDDFHHPPDWLETLHADYERHGPTTELPVFVGRDPLATLFEPAYAMGGTLAVDAAGIAWGGAVVFERDDLDEAAFLEDLRRTVSDDGTLSDHVAFTAVRRTRTVPNGGRVRASVHRFVRFALIVRHHSPPSFVASCVLAVATLVACLVAPLLAVPGIVLVNGAVYARYGIRRPSFLLAPIAAMASIPLLAYALVRRSFVWGGRRYRWRDKYDVAVLAE